MGMSGGRIVFLRNFAVALTAIGAVCAAAPALAATQVGYAQSENASESLARYIRLLAVTPRSFDALIGAGKAAIELGDTQAAAGFFGRAEEVNPRSPQPQAGMAAALVQSGDATGALRYFAMAMQFGATQSMIGADRGLAYDLLGQHAQAQGDYRAAMARGGSDGNEARRRLALSLAITGNRAEALATLSPLMARGDAAGARCRAFALALTGDAAGARAAIEAAMPGAAWRMDPFLRKLPALRSDQKAAAVHLGIFPDSGQPVYAAASPPAYARSVTGVSVSTQPVTGDRLSEIEHLLTGTANSTPAASQPSYQPAVQMASIPRVRREQPSQTSSGSAVSTKRFWVQLASGKDAAALPRQFRRIVSNNRDSFNFDGINGYVAEEPGKARLLVGPFKDAADANTFADNLESVDIDAFSWTALPGQMIRKLPSE